MPLNPNQDYALRFLTHDHGEAIIASPLECHPLAQEFELTKGDIIATFTDACFILTQDGGMSPIYSGDSE